MTPLTGIPDPTSVAESFGLVRGLIKSIRHLSPKHRSRSSLLSLYAKVDETAILTVKALQEMQRIVEELLNWKNEEPNEYERVVESVLDRIAEARQSDKDSRDFIAIYSGELLDEARVTSKQYFHVCIINTIQSVSGPRLRYRRTRFSLPRRIEDEVQAAIAGRRRSFDEVRASIQDISHLIDEHVRELRLKRMNMIAAKARYDSGLRFIE